MAYEFNPYQCPLGLGLYFYVEVLKAKKTFEDEYQCPLGLGLYFYLAKQIETICLEEYQCPLGLGLYFYTNLYEILSQFPECINALSGWGSISTVPLRKPRFYAVSGACFCRYLSEYSDNDHFSCMLTIWTYLIATSYLGLF